MPRLWFFWMFRETTDSEVKSVCLAASLYFKPCAFSGGIMVGYIHNSTNIYHRITVNLYLLKLSHIYEKKLFL